MLRGKHVGKGLRTKLDTLMYKIDASSKVPAGAQASNLCSQKISLYTINKRWNTFSPNKY